MVPRARLHRWYLLPLYHISPSAEVTGKRCHVLLLSQSSPQAQCKVPPCQAGPAQRVFRLQSNTPRQGLAGAGGDEDAPEHSLRGTAHPGDLGGGGSPSGPRQQRSFCCSAVFHLPLCWSEGGRLQSQRTALVDVGHPQREVCGEGWNFY